MNFKYINRKQLLGISLPVDFAEWTLKLDNEPVERSLDTARSMNSLLDHIEEWGDYPADFLETRVHPHFDYLIDELGLEFQHCDVEETTHTKFLQSIHSEAMKVGLYLNIIDIRPVSELGDDLTDTEILDKMVTECGCNPLGECWVNYSPDDGCQTLNVMFQKEIAPWTSRTFTENDLANKVLDYFDSTVRFYGTNCYAPWPEDWHKKIPFRQSKRQQFTYDNEFGLILRDRNLIGFLFVAGKSY